MEEKIINEFKVVETEDGFRIEIKGDKEAIRKMLKDFGPWCCFGNKGQFNRGFHFGFGPFWDWFGDWFGSWEKEEEKKEEEKKA
jgi:hypothetical protein